MITLEQQQRAVKDAQTYLDMGMVFELVVNGVATRNRISEEQAGEIVKEVQASRVIPQMVSAPVEQPQAETAQDQSAPKSQFRVIAERSIARGEKRILPIAVGGKNPGLSWKDSALDLASTSEWAGLVSQWIDELDQKFPEMNACVIAKPDEFVFIDNDTAKEFREGYENYSHEKYPETFTTSATPNHYQEHFRQTDLTRSMGNVVQFCVDGISLSVRQRNLYVLIEGSRHPSGRVYQTIVDHEIVPMPAKLVEYIQHLEKKAHQDTIRPSSGTQNQDWKPIDITIEGAPIPHGQHDSTLFKIASSLRQRNWDRQVALDHLVEVCQARCVNYGPDFRDMCEKKIGSAWKYEVKETGKIEFPSESAPAGSTAELTPVDVPVVPYPKFPRWVIDGTSIGEGLVKPFCKQNSRYPEYMFMPAMVMTLNYLALKVNIEGKQIIPSMYLVSAGRKGRVIKSSSANDAAEYLTVAGLFASSATTNAEGRSVMFTAGSPEGLGLEMARTNCKNAVLFYDELGVLSKKASIEKSTLGEQLATMYESGLFSNAIKSRKQSFNFPAKTYCTSLIACTTDKSVVEQMGALIASAKGMDERFFYLYQPEFLVPMTHARFVNTVEAAQKTRELVAKAVLKQVYRFADDNILDEIINELGNRGAGRVERMALFFAVDLGLDEITEGCVERAIALERYNQAVQKWLRVPETTTREGALQNELISLLMRHGGKMSWNDIDRSMHPERHGTFLWSRVYGGLLSAGWIGENGAGKKGDPKQIVLLRTPAKDDD